MWMMILLSAIENEEAKNSNNGDFPSARLHV